MHQPLTRRQQDIFDFIRAQIASNGMPPTRAEIASTLVLAAQTENMGYPVLAKLFHQRLGTFTSARSRSITFDVRERYWALDAVIDALFSSTENMRTRIAGQTTA